MVRDLQVVGDRPVLLGGPPVHADEWPPWPRAGAAAQRALLNTLHSDTWTLSGRGRREPVHERVFADAFAARVGRRYGIACASGTAALTIALQALDIGPGDEVIVPGLTWVACASAVLHIGARPVLADIDPQTLVMTVETVRPLMGPRTAAVLGVPMYASRADMPGLARLCEGAGIALIEDGSQAHGAQLDGRPIGGFGRLSVFSFQQSKLLTGGEGGIVVTDDATLAERLEHLRADGRAYSGQPGFWRLKPGSGITGRNLVMSEFSAVLLREGLGRLDVENAHRRRMAARLGEALSALGWCGLTVDALPDESGRTFYKIPIRLDHEGLLAAGPERVAAALSADLNLPVEPLDRPLDATPLYRPESVPLARGLARLDSAAGADSRPPPLPQAHAAWARHVALPHQSLLGGEPEVDSIVHALRRLGAHAAALREATPTANAPGGAR